MDLIPAPLAYSSYTVQLQYFQLFGTEDIGTENIEIELSRSAQRQVGYHPYAGPTTSLKSGKSRRSSKSGFNGF
jgi:hypothetical protein